MNPAPEGSAEPGRDDLRTRVASLTGEQRRALARRLHERRDRDAITRRPTGEPAPLSFAQSGLWFLDQLRPGSHAYNSPIVTRLEGQLDAGALRDSLQLVVDRHQTFRTVINTQDGEPRPVAVPDASVQLSFDDLPEASEDHREQLLQRLVETEIRRPFDLGRDLMLRARLIRLGPEMHVLVLVAHHIACDGWSKGILLAELGQAYGALATGAGPSLPVLPIQYGDFALWQRRWLAGERLETLEGYWRETLTGHPPCLLLPADRPRPPIQTFRGSVRWISVGGELVDALTALGRSERATPFMTMLAAFAAVLHACSGQDEILIGSPSAMRDRPETEHLIGFFANTLVYRVDLSGRPCFRELLRRVKRTALGVYSHQELPFDQIVRAVQPSRDASRNPLVQANLRLEDSEPELRLDGLRTTRIEIDPGIARFDVAIELATAPDGLSGYLEYATDLFDAATATQLADDLLAALSAVVAAPDVPLPALPAIEQIAGREPAPPTT